MMKIASRLICTLEAVSLLACTAGHDDSNIIEIPLTAHNGSIVCNIGATGLSANSDRPDNPWAKTYLTLSGLPDGLEDIKVGHIESNIYQSAYQDYLKGDISEEWYTYIQKAWNWIPDTLNMSKEPIKTKAAFAYGKDKNGKTTIVVDCNNNLDLRDDPHIHPYNAASGQRGNIDSIADANKLNVRFETFTDNRVIPVTVPVFIKIYDNDESMMFFNIMQYMSATYHGRDILVFSNGNNLSYRNISVALQDEIKGDDGRYRFKDNIYTDKEFIRIDDDIYRVLGANTNRMVFRMEKIRTSKEKLQSPQTGYHAPGFEVQDFISGDTISLDFFKGKYLLIDYWATWCGPCRTELPMLKRLYDRTDRSEFEILGFVGNSTANDLENTIKEYNIGWRQVMTDNVLKEKYRPEGYPSTFLIDPDGIIIAKNLRGEELEDMVIKLLGK